MQSENKINSESEIKNTENHKNKNSVNPSQPVRQRANGVRVRKYISVIWEFLKIVIIAAVIVLPIRYFLFQPFIVKGESMVPNFHSGDYLIIDEVSYRFGSPQRGDVVVLKFPLDNKQRFIKRVIGLPGETVEVKGGEIAIYKNGNNIPLDEERYLPRDLDTEGNVKTSLGDNEYFVMGDNRQFSYDSRSWGVLPRKDIIGRAVFRLFPITNVSLITSPTY